MLDLEQSERDEILEAFQKVISFLRDQSDEAAITALAMLNEGKVIPAKKLAEEASMSDWALTVIKTYLESIYKQAVSLH